MSVRRHVEVAPHPTHAPQAHTHTHNPIASRPSLVMSDDNTQRAAVMAAAAAAITHVQNLNQIVLLDDDDELDGMGASGGGLAGMGDWWADGEEESEQPKQVRASYPRPAYMESEWGQWLQKLQELHAAGGVDPACREAVRFQEHFRVSYEFFVHLVETVKPVFPSATHDVAGRECVPLELKVLAVLKVLGGGNCFNDISGFSRMSRQTAEYSFHHFCEKFSEGLWETWVCLPEGEELTKIIEIYRKCGYPGAMGSVDCTHFKWDCTPFSERSIHQGKEGYPSVVVEATCDHSGRIIAATKSFPGAENDKTVIARDASIWRVRDEEPWKSRTYKLRNADGTETEHTGAWLIVDGGYPKIPLLMPPIKVHQNSAEHDWSTRLESVRKDIECCFGRLKGRWRLFKGGILYGSREKIDNAWFTACILHNMLHKYNGLDKMEEQSDWVGSAGATQHDQDAAGMTVVNDTPADNGFESARAKLVAHFKYCNDRREILWFKRAA